MRVAATCERKAAMLRSLHESLHDKLGPRRTDDKVTRPDGLTR